MSALASLSGNLLEKVLLDPGATLDLISKQIALRINGSSSKDFGCGDQEVNE